MTLKQFKQEFRGILKIGDHWGTTLDALFECAGRLNRRRAPIPPEWGFYPGMGTDGMEKDNYWHSLFGTSSTKQLSEIGSFLNRYANYLKYKELDY